ncbi:MAG: hypothetical protein ACK4N5_14465 [Myxococcales bacterium]
MSAPTEPQRTEAPDAPPPFLGSWRNVYLLVLGELLVTVILFRLLTEWAS